uniref:Uncharacterized protein n=1 Tax=Macaca fascicularis TaxID=9541 RepID=A0A2K5UM09_MACFA
MASCGVQVSAAGSANETPKIPDNVGDWLWGVYRFPSRQMESCAEPKSSKKQPTICDHQKMCPDSG